MILSNDFFECLDDIFQWWESDLIEYDKQKQNKIISEIKKCQMELFGIDGRGGLTANWMKESDEIKVARKVKLSNAADFEEFRQRELNCILMHENIQSKVFILERWEDLYTVSIIKKANEEKQQLLKTKTLLKFSDELIGNLVREKFTASSESRQHRIGGTRALDAAGTPNVWRKLYKEMINPDEIKKGYNIFNWYIENTSWVKTDKEKHYREVLKKVKLSNISDFFGDLGRGNAWETVIINKLAKKHPGKISIAPYNYIYNKNEKLVARFDALKLGPSGEVEEIIEIKNTNKIEVFLPLEDLQTETSQKSLSPALAVPKRYAHQLLFYMKMANVVRGKIVALVNIFDLTKSDNVLNIKEYTISVDDEVVNFVPHINKKPARLLDVYNLCFEKVLEFTQFFADNFAKGYKSIPPPRAAKNDAEAANLFENIKQIFADDKVERIVAIDVETTESRILEFGALVTDKKGNLIEEYGNLDEANNKNVLDVQTLFSVPEHLIESNFGELPFQELHHITPQDVADKKRFDQLDQMSKIHKLLLDPNQVLMFHNKRMENGKFSLWVKGYCEALKKGNIKVIDTMEVSKYLDHEKKDESDKFWQNDTLDSYSKRWAVRANSETGDELHRGYDDARIMIETFFKHIKSLY